jgi:hypothetical protein
MTATGGMGATAREGWSMPSSSCMLSFFFLLILLCFYINGRGKRRHQTKQGEHQHRKGRTRPKAGSPQRPRGTTSGEGEPPPTKASPQRHRELLTAKMSPTTTGSDHRQGRGPLMTTGSRHRRGGTTTSPQR